MRLCDHFAITTFLVATVILNGFGERADSQPKGATEPGSEAPRIVYLEQNWDARMRADYYYEPQGSRLIPQAWFGALEQADNDSLFAERDNLARFGLLYAETQPEARHLPPGLNITFDLPIGFAIDPENQADTGHWLGMSCAACHTNNVVVKDPMLREVTLRVDGAPSMFDIGRFITALSAAVAASQPYPDDQAGQTVSPKFRAFAARLPAEDRTKEQLRELALQYAAFADRFITHTKMSIPPHPAGPGRVDALTQIVNELAVFNLGIDANHRPPIAPISFPFVWLAPRLEWVQWNPIASNPIARNSGEVLGVFGALDLGDDVEQRFSSSIQFESLFKLEQWIASLEPPRWREDIMGLIDPVAAVAGAKLFKADCLGCHNMQIPDQDGKLSYRLTDAKDNFYGKRFIEIKQVPYKKVGTDSVYIDTLLHREVATGDLAVVLFEGKSTVPAIKFFSKTVEAALCQGLNKLQLGEKALAEYIDYRNRPTDYRCPIELPPDKPLCGDKKPYKPCRYDTLKAGPLDAIWATGPFLHNGSVRNIDELLSPPEERSDTFWVGSGELDTNKLGFVSTEKGGGVVFNTQLPGNSNAGHHYPRNKAYSPDERMQIIEYLKDPRRFAEFLVKEAKSATVDISLTAFDMQPPGETEQIADIATKTTQLQDLRPDFDQPIHRGVHAKAHGCVSAKFTINDNLDEQYQVGLFRNPGQSFQAKIRFSNAAVLDAHDLDGGNGSRGMAIKVLDVDGPFLNAYQGGNNQDFLMINTTRFAFPTVRAYGFLTDTLLQSPKGAKADKLIGLGRLTPEEFAALQAAKKVPDGFSVDDYAAVQETFGVVVEIRRTPVLNPTQAQYFGAAPFLFGANQIMKFSAAPCVAVDVLALEDTPNDAPRDYLRDALKQSMQGDEEICYNFQIQVRSLGEIGTDKIENASTEWPGERDNYADVAKITIPLGQDIDSAVAEASCEQLVFTPWHSLAAHQPVGGINRLRLDVYRNSARHRRISSD
jgi:hypothetical protein